MPNLRVGDNEYFNVQQISFNWPYARFVLTLDPPNVPLFYVTDGGDTYPVVAINRINELWEVALHDRTKGGCSSCG